MYDVIYMLGIDLNIKEALYDAIAGARNTALGKLPMYNAISGIIRKYQADKKLKGPKTGTNTVDEYEFGKAIAGLRTEINGSLNPFSWVWGMIQTLLGSSKSERTVAHIQVLENYAHQHDGFKFVNDAQECLLTAIENRISTIESLSSKYVGTSSNKVINDPVLKALKSAIQAWLEPFNKIINGELAEIAKLSEGDMKVLMNLRDRIQYSPRARYMEDLLPKYNELIIEAQRARYSNQQVGQTQPRAQQRRTGRNLAKTAA